MKTTMTLCATALLAACGILNLGGTNEDGTPKDGADARALFRSIGDAALQTWGTDALKKDAPGVMQLFDANEDGVLSLMELEGAVNLEDPNATTMVLVAAITLYRARSAR